MTFFNLSIPILNCYTQKKNPATESTPFMDIPMIKKIELSLGLNQISDDDIPEDDTFARVSFNEQAWNIPNPPKKWQLTPHFFKYNPDTDNDAETCIAILPANRCEEHRFNVSDYLKNNVFIGKGGTLTVNPIADVPIALIRLQIKTKITDNSMLGSLKTTRLTTPTTPNSDFTMDEFQLIQDAITFKAENLNGTTIANEGSPKAPPTPPPPKPPICCTFPSK